MNNLVYFRVLLIMINVTYTDTLYIVLLIKSIFSRVFAVLANVMLFLGNYVTVVVFWDIEIEWKNWPNESNLLFLHKIWTKNLQNF